MAHPGFFQRQASARRNTSLLVRLIALLSGILMIGQIGGFLLRSSFYSGGRGPTISCIRFCQHTKVIGASRNNQPGRRRFCY